jgi:hypothetical protein
MAEVEFEENCAEIKEYLYIVRDCKQQITQIPTVLKKLLDLLKTSTALLEDLCTFADAPETLHQQCVRSRQRLMDFYEGSALKSLTDSIQDVVHQRLLRMEQIAQQSHMACKRRRDARAKYLSDTNGKGPFNFAAPSPEKVQKHKEEYTSSDETYRQACAEFAQYRFNEMGTVQKDFCCGYSGVFALMANALNLPLNDTGDRNDVALTSSSLTNTRERMRRQQQRPKRSFLGAGAGGGLSTSRSTAATDGTVPISSSASALAAPPLAAEESRNYQRRLSDGIPVDKPNTVPSATDTASCGMGCNTGSMRSGEVVNGIPVLGGSGYGNGTYMYTTRAPEVTTAPAPTNNNDDSSTSSSSQSSSSNKSSTTSSASSAHGEEASGSDVGAAPAAAAGAAAPLRTRKSSSATVSHFDNVSSDGGQLRHEYSLFNSFDSF